MTMLTDQPPTTTRRRRFLRGLRGRTPLVLAVAVALVFPALFAIDFLFSSGAYTVVPERALLRTARDDFLHNSYTVGRLKRHPPDRLPVYLIGGSAARESLISDRSFADAVQRASGVPVRTYVLSNYDQTFGQSLAIVDNLPPGRGIVVLAVNNNRFHFSPAKIAKQLRGLPLLLESASLRQFIDGDPASSTRSARLPGALPGILDYVVGYLGSHATALAQARSLAPAYKTHWITQRKVWSLAQKKAGVERWVKGARGHNFYRYYPYNARLLDEVVQRAGQRGFKVVLLEETEDTDVVGHSFDAFKRIYKPIVRGVAAKYGVPYLDLQESLHLPDSAFWDFIHPVESARVVWQRVLAKALAPVVRGAASASSSSSATARLGGGATGAP